MGRNSRRAWLAIAVCGALGIIFGATTSQAAINECMTTSTPTNECLLQDPVVKRVEGIGMGLFVGVGAAIGATWQVWTQEN